VELDRSHALRGNASTDALRSAFDGTRSVPGCIPTRSVGMISEGRLFADFRDGLGQQVKADASIPATSIVPTLCVGMLPRTLCVRLLMGRVASRAAFPRGAWERSVKGDYLQTFAMASTTRLRHDASVPATSIVPTLCVGMPPRTLCVRLLMGRGASRAAFPRGAWERSVKGDYLQTFAMASANRSRRDASIPATFARPELTMYTLWLSRRSFTCSGDNPV